MTTSDSLLAVLDEYLDYCHIICTPQTVKQYTLVLRKVVQDLGGSTRLIDEVTSREVQRYQTNQWGHLKRNTVSGYTAILKTFFAWAVARDYLEKSPALSLPRPPRSHEGADPRAIPPDHLRQILDFAQHTSPRNYALLMFLIATGCRVGGLLSIGMADLDLPQYRASIRLKGGKRDKVFFGDVTRSALEAYLLWRPACAHDRLWVWEKQPYKPLQNGGVCAMIIDICQRLHLPKEYFTQGTRHSVGLSWTKAGIALGIVSTKLGHSDIAITHEYYAKPDQEFIALVSRRYETLPLQDNPLDALAGKIIRAG